jgi:hypothetical protein
MAMGVVYFLNKLHSHVTAAAYEDWVRNVDYPTAATIPSIVEYRVARLEGLLEGDGSAPYDYIERVLVTDLDAYRRDLKDPRLEDFGKQWSSYVASSTAVYGTMIE